VASGLAFFASVILIVRWRRNRRNANANVQLQGQTVTTSTPAADIKFTGMTTLQVTTHELSIPAYLEFKFGESFVQDKFIAKGGGGSIYTCRFLDLELTDLGKHEPIVVKNLGVSVDRLSANLAAAFWQEITIMWKFRNHDMFCKIAGYSTDPACMIMRHYQMGDLRHFMLSNNAKFPYTKLLITDFMLQYVKGIAIMHSYEIVHCDIKPANCLLEENSGKLRLIIADFGISRIVSTSALQVKAFIASTLKGASVVYAAPEVMQRFRGQNVADAAVIWKAGDLFALGVTMLELLQRNRAW
jgi:serine/threonine protein kinase